MDNTLKAANRSSSENLQNNQRKANYFQTDLSSKNDTPTSVAALHQNVKLYFLVLWDH